MAERRLLTFEPRLLPRAATNVSKAMADVSLDSSLWLASGAVELPALVWIARSFSPEAAAITLVSIGIPLMMVSVVQGRRFMERYFNIPSKFNYST